MATNIENSFTISENGLSLNEEALILHGSQDPSLAPGQEAPIGSLFLRTGTPELYQKNSSPDTGWALVGGSSTGSSNIPVVQLLRTSNQNLTTSYVDINFDITDLETDSSVIEHDNTNIDRILIKETALYQVQYSMSVDANAGENIFDFRVRINDTNVIASSQRQISEDDEINAVSNIFFTTLTAGTFISLQTKSNGTGDVLWNTCNFSIAKATSAQGAQGPAGAGSTILVYNDGVLLPNNPHDKIDFVDGITAIDDPTSVKVSVQPSLFGSEFHQAESLGVTSTTSDIYQQKLLMNIPSIPSGKYRIGLSYGWNYNSQGNDFIAELREDGVKIGEIHRQEPKDSAGSFSGTNSNQRFYISRTFYRTLTTGAHTYSVHFRSALAGTTASIWECQIEFWRVG